MLKAAVERLGWTHLEITDIYVNTTIAGDRKKDMGVGMFPSEPGTNSDTELFQYLHQEGLLDGKPLTFIETGVHGSIPWSPRTHCGAGRQAVSPGGTG